MQPRYAFLSIFKKRFKGAVQRRLKMRHLQIETYFIAFC